MAAEQEASWAELPLDLLTAVLSCLPAKDLVACARWVSLWTRRGFCSHSFQACPQRAGRRTARSAQLSVWRKLCLRHSPPPLTPAPLPAPLLRSVCTAWRAAADQEGLWALQRHRDFPQADDATVAVLLERAGGSSGGSESSGSSGSRRVQQHRAAKLAYWWLAREWTCERCQQVRRTRCWRPVHAGRQPCKQVRNNWMPSFLSPPP